MPNITSNLPPIITSINENEQNVNNRQQETNIINNFSTLSNKNLQEKMDTLENERKKVSASSKVGQKINSNIDVIETIQKYRQEEPKKSNTYVGLNVNSGNETKKSLRNMNVKELGSEKDRINNLIKEIENKRQQSNYSTISSMEKAKNINKINKYRKNLKNIETLLTSSSSNTQESINNTNLWEIGIQRLPSNEKKKFITNEIALINSEIEIIRNNLEDISKKFINKEINSTEYNKLKDNYNSELEEQMKKMNKLTSFLKSIKKGGYRQRKTYKKNKKSKRKTYRNKGF